MTNKQLISLKKLEISEEIIKKIPAQIALYYQILPVAMENNILTIASARVLDVEILDEIGIVFSGILKTILVDEQEIKPAITHYYGFGADTIEKMMNDSSKGVDLSKDISIMDEKQTEASISKFLNQMLSQAYHNRATDIHIEPFENFLSIRYRVDGVLYDAQAPRDIKYFKDEIISRVKILCHLNIAERRMPQDGRFQIKIEDVHLDVRASFLPTPLGESVVLRILNRTALVSLDMLGFSEEEKNILNRLIEKPYGIIFLTGPTGSGKTTTLYSCLTRLHLKEKKIITIEDPIEYQINGITQIQVNPKIGLSFAEGLRSMLRHDPDVMMVGEVRDKETAEIAIQSALTGHVIFSTLHTNDAASGITRLLDMGIEAYLMTSTVQCFIAQRLVRVLCPHCKKLLTEKEISHQFRDWIKRQCPEMIKESFRLYGPLGCDLCGKTGYWGREAIFEILVMDDTIREAVMKKETSSGIKARAVSSGMITLRETGLKKVLEGKTTWAEILRVSSEG